MTGTVLDSDAALALLDDPYADLTDAQWHDLLDHPDGRVRAAVAERVTSGDAVLALLSDPDPRVRAALADSEYADEFTLRHLAGDDDPVVRSVVAWHPWLPDDAVAALAADPDERVRRDAVQAQAGTGLPARAAVVAGIAAAPEAAELREWLSAGSPRQPRGVLLTGNEPMRSQATLMLDDRYRVTAWRRTDWTRLGHPTRGEWGAAYRAAAAFLSADRSFVARSCRDPDRWVRRTAVTNPVAPARVLARVQANDVDAGVRDAAAMALLARLAGGSTRT